MLILLALAAVLVAAPIAAALLVSLASLREDARHSLGGKAPSRLARAARWLLRVQPPGVVHRSMPTLPAPRRPRRTIPPQAGVPRPRDAADSQSPSADADLASWLTGPRG